MIAAGHRWTDVQGYSLGQLELFLAAIADEEKASRRMALMVARTAQAEDKHYKKALKELS